MTFKEKCLVVSAYVITALAAGGVGSYLVSQTGYVVVPGGIGISATDKLALDDSIVNPHTWAEDAVRNKVSNCRERMIATWYPQLLGDAGITSVPNSKDGLIELIASRPWYKNRVQRDSIEAANRPK